MIMATAQIALYAAVVLVTIAAYFDIRSHRIPNAITYPAWAVGLLLAGLTAGWPGVVNSGIGFAVTFVPLFIMFVGGTMGGGDVKLMAGVGALLGFPAGLNALISSIIVGGFFAAVILLWQGRLFPILKHAASVTWSKIYWAHVPVDPPPQQKDAFPFGVAIALGTYLTVASILVGLKTPANLFT